MKFKCYGHQSIWFTIATLLFAFTTFLVIIGSLADENNELIKLLVYLATISGFFMFIIRIVNYCNYKEKSEHDHYELLEDAEHKLDEEKENKAIKLKLRNEKKLIQKAFKK